MMSKPKHIRAFLALLALKPKQFNNTLIAFLNKKALLKSSS
jgi:hypothetical protein